MAPSIQELSNYLSLERGSIEITLVETKNIDQIWKGAMFPWYGPTCLAVVCYVIKFCTNSDDGIAQSISRLNDLASEYWTAVGANMWFNLTNKGKMNEQLLHAKERISDIFVNSFMPKVEKFFKVPKLHELSNKDPNSIKENELLAAFIDFLLQILNSEADFISDQEQRYTNLLRLKKKQYANLRKKQRHAILHKKQRCTALYKKQRHAILHKKQRFPILHEKLTFLLSILGDIPFQCTEHEEVIIILAEFEILANEIGRFIYSCVFVTHHVKPNRFIKMNAILKMVEFLIIKIKEHCINFSKLSRRVITEADVIDSLFIVDSLLEDLENLINHRVDLTVDGIKVQIAILHEELRLSRSFLKYIEIPKDIHMDHEQKESLVHIRDVAYEAEYLVNSYVVGNLPLWYLSARLRDVTKKIKLIGTRLLEIKKIYGIKTLKVMKDFSGEVSFQAMRNPTTMIETIVLGFDDARTKILSYLIGESKNQQILSIFGMPGLGKTTIARELYKDRSIVEYFDRRAWCVISQTYQRKKVLIEILMSLTSNKSKNKFLQMKDECLAVEIHKSLKGRRYLIVLDDIWLFNVWDDLKRNFPDDINGSRIMFTSRIRDIAPVDSVLYTPALFTEDQCWELLKKKVFSKECCPPQLLNVGKRIAAKCNGLPLAVVVTAGILSNLEKEESEWTKVETNLDSYIFKDDTHDCLKILELSYKHLPNHLKMCFLYFGAFSEDTEISVRKLIWMWIAEGFIRREHTRSPEHVAEHYLYELINRSLVLITKTRSDGRIKACSIHDLLRDMCLRRAHGDNFLKSIKDHDLSIYERHHRMFDHSATPDRRPFSLHCRSFSGHVSQPSSSFPQMALLRVMDLLRIFDSGYELKRIDLLVQLRYLAVDRMPEPYIRNFVNLEFLCVNCQGMVNIPSAILKMVKLRHLHVKIAAKFEIDLDFSQTTNLRSLSYVCINNHKDEEILRASPHLRKLKCTIFEPKRLYFDFSYLSELESLKMLFYKPLHGELANINFPLTIKNLSLSGIGLAWENISVVGKLPHLYVLKLGFNSFKGEEWTTKVGEFEELRFLKLDSLIGLKQWITCSEHFPKLRCLVLSACINLEEIPIDLGNIMTLKTIEMIHCGHAANISAVRIEEEQRDQYGNEELKVIITSYQWSKEKLFQECREV